MGMGGAGLILNSPPLFHTSILILTPYNFFLRVELDDGLVRNINDISRTRNAMERVR